MQYPPPLPQPELKVFSRFVKILYFTLFGSVGLYWAVLELMAANVEARDLGTMKLVFVLAAASAAALVLYWRFGRISRLLANTAADLATRLPRLRADYIVCYTLSEAMALYGFCWRMLGGSREEAALYFLASVALFLLCYPRIPETPGSPGV